MSRKFLHDPHYARLGFDTVQSDMFLSMFGKNMLPSVFKTYLYLDDGGNTIQCLSEEYESTPKIEAVCSSESLVPTYQTTRCHN
jgi:hypothetical protein